MKLEELEKKYEELGAEIEALKNPKPWPQEGDEYWVITETGKIQRRALRIKTQFDETNAVGNAFRTREEAEREASRRKVMKKLKDLAGDWKPDWNSDTEQKYFLGFDRCWIATFIVGIRCPFTIYFPTREAGQAAIDELGDELNVLLEDG